MNYKNFIKSKGCEHVRSGFKPGEIQGPLMDFQKHIVQWGLKTGNFACFGGTGTGKTIMELETAAQIARHEPGNILIIAPLTVTEQTINEARKFGYHDLEYCTRSGSASRFQITNYERIESFDPSEFIAVILDESSIIKNWTSKTRTTLQNLFTRIKYRSCWTATPAPNDWEELGTTSEFLGVLKQREMLARFFTHDGGDTSKWNLKGHAEDRFYEWMVSWCVMFDAPGQIGFPHEDQELPDLIYHEHIVETPNAANLEEMPSGMQGELFQVHATGLNGRRKARKATIEARCARAAEVVASEPNKQWCIWTGLNDESALMSNLTAALEIKGATPAKQKKEAAMMFASGKLKRMVSKTTIFGFGMNWQKCQHLIYVGLSDSWEQLYQSIRRFWRRGQKKTVHVHMVISDQEGNVLNNIKKKDAQALELKTKIIEAMEMKRKKKSNQSQYMKDIVGEGYLLKHGDVIERILEVGDNDVDFSIFSPPFSSLYTYTDSEKDMGNSRDDREFLRHYNYLIPELLRVTQPGRLLAFHIANMPAMIERDGYFGIKDLRGMLIRMHQRAGWIYHSETVIWKDPLIEATRTHAHGLLYKQACKDSAKCRQGLPDYLVVMRKPGENKSPIPHAIEKGFGEYRGTNPPPRGDKYMHHVWQRYASPVWIDIDQTDTLNARAAREKKDERHICPLQLGVIARALQLWSKPGDLVFSPCMGIGSEGRESMLANRRFLGVELKKSYFQQAAQNIETARKEAGLLPFEV